MGNKGWWIVGAAVVAYFAWRTSQWADSGYPKKPYAQALRLALTHPFSGPGTEPAKEMSGTNIMGKGTAGDGTGKSGPTIVQQPSKNTGGVIFTNRTGPQSFFPTT